MSNCRARRNQTRIASRRYYLLHQTQLLVDPIILRCDTPNNAISFYVLIDSAKRSVLNMGFATKIEIDQLCETM
jgi:hypothetical protein